MTLVIALPDIVEINLRKEAKKRRLPPELLAARILEEALITEPFPTPEEVVAKIRALPKRSQNIRPAKSSLLDALQNSPNDPDFDLAEWQASWDAIEAEIKAVERANDIAEGRG